MSLACTDVVSESCYELMDKIMSEIVHHITKLLIVKSRTLWSYDDQLQSKNLKVISIWSMDLEVLEGEVFSENEES